MNLVTGATGLVGSWLLLELSKRGLPVRAMKRAGSSKASVKKLFQEFEAGDLFDKIEWVETDLLDITTLPQALKGIETLFHSAAFVSYEARHRKKIYCTNVTGTENLVNIATNNGVSNLVLVSSIATLNSDEGNNHIDELSKWNPEKPHSWYAASKKRAEMEFYRAAAETASNVMIVHPSVIIGSLDGKRPSEDLFRRIFRKNAFATRGKTGYVDVRDVAYCLAELSSRALWNQRFVLNSGNRSFVEVFDFVRNNYQLGKTKVLSDTLLKILKVMSWVGVWLGGRVIDDATFAALTGDSVYSVQKVKDLLGFEFVPVEESLLFHAERYLSQKSTQPFG